MTNAIKKQKPKKCTVENDISLLKRAHIASQSTQSFYSYLLIYFSPGEAFAISRANKNNYKYLNSIGMYYKFLQMCLDLDKDKKVGV